MHPPMHTHACMHVHTQQTMQDEVLLFNFIDLIAVNFIFFSFFSGALGFGSIALRFLGRYSTAWTPSLLCISFLICWKSYFSMTLTITHLSYPRFTHNILTITISKLPSIIWPVKEFTIFLLPPLQFFWLFISLRTHTHIAMFQSYSDAQNHVVHFHFVFQGFKIFLLL
jgi:hypothetical protein